MPSPSPVRQIEALSLLGRYLWQDPPLADILEEAARLAAIAAGADAAVVLERLPGRDNLLVRASYGWTTPPSSGAFAGQPSAATRAIDSPAGRIVIRDLAEDQGRPHRAARRIHRRLRRNRRPDAPSLWRARGLRPGRRDLRRGLRGLRGGAVVHAGPGHPARTAHAGTGPRTRRAVPPRLAGRGVRGRHRQRHPRRHDPVVESGCRSACGWLRGQREIIGQDVSVLVPDEHQADRHHLLARVREGERIWPSTPTTATRTARWSRCR
ncbi:MAG: hypothetical protein R2712_14325 [Vicinamibacterales bacterium]